MFDPGGMGYLFDFCSYPVRFVEIELFRRGRLFLREDEFCIYERDDISEPVAKLIHRQPLAHVDTYHSTDEVAEDFPG